MDYSLLVTLTWPLLFCAAPSQECVEAGVLPSCYAEGKAGLFREAMVLELWMNCGNGEEELFVPRFFL